MNANDLRLDEVLQRIDVYGRLAFGGQCVAAMAILAAPVLFVTCAIIPFHMWGEDRGDALVYWLGGWALSLAVEASGIAFAVFCWRWSGDWITEWPGYAVGFSFAAAGLGVLAWMLTSTPVPVPLSFAATMAAVFVAGLLVAGHLGGARVLPEQRQERQRVLARRR